MKTQSVKKDDVQRKWFVVDADNKVLGRLAARVAAILRGKHKAIFTPHVDTGDFVIVVNAEKVALTGRKMTDKVKYSYSGYPGGIKAATAGDRMKNKPEDVVRQAVKGMLPKNRLGSEMVKKLKVYSGSEHKHSAQKPEVLQLG